MGSDVLAFCRRLYPLLPVVVMSGSPKVDVRTDALSQGADSFIQKPFSNSLMAQHIRFLLQRVRHGTALFRLDSEAAIIPLEELKSLYVRSVVTLLGGNVSEAARRLDLNRQTVARLVGEANR
jgi:DNA-binding NtrC family response regulator